MAVGGGGRDSKNLTALEEQIDGDMLVTGDNTMDDLSATEFTIFNP